MATATLTLRSQNQWLADGATEFWDFSFAGGYITASHVKAYSLSPDDIRTEREITSFAAEFRVRISPAIPDGHTLVIYRDSTNGGVPLVNFEDGAEFDEASMALLAKQAVFMDQETRDASDGTNVAVAVADAQASVDAAAASEVAAAASEAAAAGSAATATAQAVIAANAAAAAWGNVSYHPEYYTSTAGQTVFPLVTAYNPGSHSVSVYVDGYRLRDDDYVETNSQTITLVSPLAAGSEVDFIIGGSVSAIESLIDTGNVAYHAEYQTATEGQTSFVLANEYVPGGFSLAVYVDGYRLRNTDYTEVDSTHVTMAVGLHAGQEVDFIVGSHVATILTFTDNKGYYSNEILNDALEYLGARSQYGLLSTEFTGATPSAQLKLAMETAMARGKKLIITTGTYNLSTVVNPTMTADLEVECEIGVRFVADAALGNRMFFLSKVSGDDISLVWTGGFSDMSAVGLGASGTAWDHFYIGENFKSVTFRNATLYSGDSYLSNSGDSGIFCVAKQFLCEHCTFQGCWDAGIYLSGDATQANGTNAIVTHNRFVKCRVGVISKRRFRRMVVASNFFEYPETGIATGPANSTLLPGDQTVIVDNIILRPAVWGVQVQISDGAIIGGNMIEDMGYTIAGVLNASARGIGLRGCKNSIVQGNHIHMRDFATGGSGHRSIHLESITFDATTYHSTGNLVSENYSLGVNVGIREEDSSQDFNRVINNVIEGATTPTIRNGVNSMWLEFGQANNRYSMTGLLSLGGQFGSESLRISPVAGATDFVTILGSTSASPIVQAIGASTNIDLRLITKGSGVLRFGTYTATAPAATGYITIKDDSGVTRKLLCG